MALTDKQMDIKEYALQIHYSLISRGVQILKENPGKTPHEIPEVWKYWNAADVIKEIYLPDESDNQVTVEEDKQER